jgi:hypothetical protein
VSDFANIHLKLDRVLYGQDQISARMSEQDETIRVLISAVSVMRDAVATQTETINRLSEAMSKEEGAGDLAPHFASIAVSLKQMKEDGARMVVLVGRLPSALGQIVQDAVTMALGDGADIPPGDRE